MEEKAVGFLGLFFFGGGGGGGFSCNFFFIVCLFLKAKQDNYTVCIKIHYTVWLFLYVLGRRTIAP